MFRNRIPPAPLSPLKIQPSLRYPSTWVKGPLLPPCLKRLARIISNIPNNISHLLLLRLTCLAQSPVPTGLKEASLRICIECVR